MRTRLWYLVKINRISGWILLLLMLLLTATGYAINGKYGMNFFFSAQQAVSWHEQVIPPTLAVFAVHAGINVFLTGRRWLRSKDK